jgi:hypothetical protein
MLDTTLLRLMCPPADPPRNTMFKFEIFHIDAAQSLGIYAARTESEALDQMARAFGFEDYADCIRECGLTLDAAKAELLITSLPAKATAP